MARNNSGLVKLEVVLHHQTDGAVLVSDDGDRKKAVWIPKSQCEIEPKGKVWELELEEQVALDKGLI